MNKRVSFDFDATLSMSSVEKFANELVKRGFEVWCVTSRYNWIDNDDLNSLCDRVGIKPYHRVFTCMNDKADFFKTNTFLFHLDDDDIEVDLINNRTDTTGIIRAKNQWRNQCMAAINLSN